jgi:type II secretory pathway pseudopilin PulG
MRRRKDSGFALLLVFLMAAVVAIMLYAEIPRVAFQSQRQKEQLLMERGEQYKRAIQVFYLTAKRWPTTLDELDSFQNRHFLRHKYVDPMTGKAEWRVIHIQGGVLTDSVLTKKQDGKGSTGSEGNYVSAYAGVGQTSTTTGVQGARPQDRRRASEGGTADGQYIPGVSPMPMPPEQPPSTEPSQPNQPGQPNQQASGAPNPGTPGNTAGGAPGMPGQQPQQQQPQGGGNQIGALPGIGAQSPTQPGAPTNPGQPNQNMSISGPGSPTSGITPPSGSNAAANIINRILMTPNPQGARIAQQAQQAAGSGTVGGGIAGIASTAEMEGIMVYNDRTAYNEWEFIMDPTKIQRAGATGSTGPGGSTPAAQTGSQSGQAPGRPASTGFGGGGGMGMTGAGGMTGGGTTGGGTAGGGTGASGAAGGMPNNIRPGRP